MLEWAAQGGGRVPILEVFKVHLDLSDVGWWLRGYRGSAGLVRDWMILKVSSKLDDSMILYEKLL